MNILFALLAFASTSGALPFVNYAEQDWELFKLTHSKTYATPSEEGLRKEIYLEKRRRISEHNKDYEKGLETFKMDVNHLSDMLPQEIYGSLQSIFGDEQWRKPRSIPSTGADSVHEVPKSVDWRSGGAVTHVKNQLECASCYAFATTGSLEGQVFLKTGTLVPLSEQNLVDCTYRLGTTAGCEGGNVPSAMNYAKTFGLDTEDAYPYSATAGRCKRNVTAVLARTKIVGYQQIEPTEGGLMSAVATIGPVAACFQTGPKFDSYKTGVFYQEDCSDMDTGHCALVVGYGTSSDGQDYWLIKNSMSDHYGESGYIRMARNKNNMCGIASYAYYPII